ncbi:hypothetical protein CA13_28830 [Planctomycetes bacterium CA13]|uniref:Uncharacterized protein n=1 Tax=Novipirellula herctigrandis TaxID=2527986 RepID=A0A5C5Z2M0_9BACT|nr:hypothetical protein CA13_28830 [Planctomycetes bacterium CA13]
MKELELLGISDNTVVIYGTLFERSVDWKVKESLIIEKDAKARPSE